MRKRTQRVGNRLDFWSVRSWRHHPTYEHQGSRPSRTDLYDEQVERVRREVEVSTTRHSTLDG